MKKEYVIAGITVVLWGTLPSVSKMLISGLSPMSVLFWGSTIASVTLLLLNLIFHGKKYGWNGILFSGCSCLWNLLCI